MLVKSSKNYNDNCDQKGWSLLHSAAQKGQLDIFTNSIFSQLTTDFPSRKPDTGLSHDLKTACQGIVLKHKESLSGNTPLHTASAHGKVDIVTEVIECNPNQKNTCGQSCIHLATQHGHLELVKYLMEKAMGDTTLGKESAEVSSYIAAMEGHLDILKFTIETMGTDAHFRVTEEAFGFTQSVGLLARYSHARSKSLVHAACLGGHLDVVRYLVDEQGCDPSHPDDNGVTPLHLACKEGQIDVVKYLLTEKNNFEVKGDSENVTPLHYAAASGHLDILKYLIRNMKCDPKSKTHMQDTALHYASDHGHFEVARYLVENHYLDPKSTTDL